MPVTLRAVLLAGFLGSTGVLSTAVDKRIDHLWGDNYPKDNDKSWVEDDKHDVQAQANKGHSGGHGAGASCSRVNERKSWYVSS